MSSDLDLRCEEKNWREAWR